MYNFAIRLYSFAVKIATPFHRKAKLMLQGQRNTTAILKAKIDRNARYVWFHASSLGEFEQGRPMMEKIKREYPDYKILLTFFSPSGYEVRKNYLGADVICYLPLDTPSNVRKFLDLANPEVAVFIKYEFWANYLNELHRRGIPTYIVSAIFRKEQVFFKWYGASYRNVLKCFKHLFVQDQASAGLLAKYGIKNVSVCGDTRFDRVMDICRQAKEVDLIERFVTLPDGSKALTLVCGSSWPQDETIFVDYFNEHPDLKLVIAPHEIHEEHLQYIESLLKRPSVRFSQADSQTIQEKDCIIIDCFGLLSSIYRYGEMAYVGGGFGTGIHNVLEAAVYKVPVIFGPKFQKFKEARDLIAAGGGFSITDSSSFSAKMDEFLLYKEALAAAGKNAGQMVQSHTGATDKIMKILSL
ncbi:3-deoxy-D-manno-octulosonic acid transferase [Parabacteroides pacaensis]|uniref:3-deoxy-D-manno-octulosonic acid transferase n=1 Tax=Parabacteroides pacaensis TaxID=2086575 RepID=UPI000D0EA67E|nr:glycosyltransferase N-terminal domain-containing protein [Parabacteroides pacaensis]